jgi:hypothetical protein
MPPGGAGNAGGPGVWDYAHASCKRACAAGCYPDEQDPQGCVGDCDVTFVQGLTHCPGQTEAYVDCVGQTEPLYFCPDYGQGSPCYTEAVAMIACLRGM